MGLKHTNANGESVLIIKIIFAETFLEKCENWAQNKFNILFFEDVALIYCKTRCFITFSLLIQMEQSKPFYTKKKKKFNLWESKFWNFNFKFLWFLLLLDKLIFVLRMA